MYLSQVSTDRILDTLRISEREAANILEALSKAPHDPRMVELRGSDRLPCRSPKGLVVQIQHPGGSGGLFLVWPRDISRSGMSFLHGNFIYPDTPIVVNLGRPNAAPARVMGKIVRCRHVGGIMHDIAVRFEQSLEMSLLTQYAVRDHPPMAGAAGMKRAQLSGQVLLIDDCVDDRELLSFICSDRGLQCSDAETLKQATELLRNHKYDLVVTDVELADGATDQIISELRKAGYAGPVIGIWLALNRGIDEKKLGSAGYVELISKPLALSGVLEAIVRHLPQAVEGRGSTEVLLSEQWSNDHMRPLILSFLGRLETQISRLEMLSNREPGEAVDASLLKLCMDLQGTSGSYGFPTISQAAAELYQLAENANSQAGELKTRVERLTSLVRNACMVRNRTLPK